jgi:hypothetical protein
MSIVDTGRFWEILVLPVLQILEDSQYWYYQYFPESSSICNTGITSIFQNLPVSAILVIPVFFQNLPVSAILVPAAIPVLQYWSTILVITVFYQYLPVSAILVQILVNTSIPVSSSIFQYLQY